MVVMSTSNFRMLIYRLRLDDKLANSRPLSVTSLSSDADRSDQITQCKRCLLTSSPGTHLDMSVCSTHQQTDREERRVDENRDL